MICKTCGKRSYGKYCPVCGSVLPEAEDAAWLEIKRRATEWTKEKRKIPHEGMGEIFGSIKEAAYNVGKSMAAHKHRESYSRRECQKGAADRIMPEVEKVFELLWSYVMAEEKRTAPRAEATAEEAAYLEERRKAFEEVYRRGGSPL